MPTCSNSISIWIFVHFLYTCIISLYYVNIIVVILFINQLRFHQHVHRHFNNDEITRRRLHHLIALIKGEIIIVFFYRLSAFLYSRLWLMKSYRSITWLYFIRWFIEATCAPFIIFVFYIGCVWKEMPVI